ncbi:MAG: hypothetical protein U5K71_12950 [Gracilimonas sp.]|nr:hypothetical protein [Gracilimonas sp.]
MTNAENVESVSIGACGAMGGGDLYGGWFLMMPDLSGSGVAGCGLLRNLFRPSASILAQATAI